MPIIIDEQTGQRVLTAKHTGDITYDLIGDSAIAEEDVFLIGDWQDWTGSGTVHSREQQMWGAIENQLFGQRAHIENNEKVTNLTDRGANAGTHRQRVIKRYKKLD
jgi:hypothetical protein